MNILQICNKVPFPPIDGGSIAMNNLTQGLLDLGCNIKILAISTSKHPFEPKNISKNYLDSTKIEAVQVDTSLNWIKAFIHLIFNKSYNLSRFYSVEFEKIIIETLLKQKFDIIQLESIYVAMYINTIKKYSSAKIVIRTHNIENEIWQQKSKLEKNIFKKKYLSILSNQLKKEEITYIQKADAIASITEHDLNWIKNYTKQINVRSFPFAININEYNIVVNQVEKKSLFFIGALDWFPNEDGLIWFLENVWNQFLKKHPDYKLYIAGRGMSNEFKQKQIKNVEILGEVSDVKQFILSKKIMIVPLMLGGGMRVKIIEGMALGKLIISTSIGAEGILCRDKKNILIANTADEFLNALTYCIDNEQLIDEIAKNAKKLVVENYDNLAVTNRLLQFYKSL